jgi:hypothetical protein
LISLIHQEANGFIDKFVDWQVRARGLNLESPVDVGIKVDGGSFGEAGHDT